MSWTRATTSSAGNGARTPPVRPTSPSVANPAGACPTAPRSDPSYPEDDKTLHHGIWIAESLVLNARPRLRGKAKALLEQVIRDRVVAPDITIIALLEQLKKYKQPDAFKFWLKRWLYRIRLPGTP